MENFKEHLFRMPKAEYMMVYHPELKGQKWRYALSGATGSGKAPSLQ